MNEFNSSMLGVFDTQSAPQRDASANVRRVDPNLYSPKLKDCKNHDDNYSAMIRFLPNVFNQAMKIAEKKVTWMKKTPDDQYAFGVDNPWSIGDRNNVINQAFYALYNTKDTRKMDIAKKCLNTQTNYYSLVQIINDPNKPELNGRIMVMQYSTQIRTKIDEECNGSEFEAGRNPFDLWAGRVFNLKIAKNGNSGFATYVNSKFVDAVPGNVNTQAGLRYVGADGQFYILTKETLTEDTKMAALNYLVNTSPKLDDYTFKPWSDETRAKVEDYLNGVMEYANNGTISTRAEVAFGTSHEGVASFTGVQNTPTTNVTASMTPSNESFFGAPSAAPQVAPQMAAPVAAPQFQTPQPAPQIVGATLPNVGVYPSEQPQAAPSNGSANPFGNLDDVLSQI